VAAVAAFGALARVAPYRSSAAPVAAQGAVGEPSPAPVQGRAERAVGSFGGLPVEMEERPVAPCDVHGWDPRASGFCPGGCLGEEREADGAHVVWMEEGSDGDPGRLHAATLTCAAGGASGTLFHFVTPGARVSVGAPDRAARQASGPVPLLPGAEPVAHYGTGRLAVFVDRPRVPAAALDAMQLTLMEDGWRLVAGPDAELPPGAPPVRVLARGRELALLTLEDEEPSPLLVTAYSRDGWGSEARR